MEPPVSREAVYNASYRPMTIIAGETVIAGEPVTPPDDVRRYGKGKGRDRDQPAYTNPYFDEPLCPLETRSSPLEAVNSPYVHTKATDLKATDVKRKTLFDELARFSFDSIRSSSDWSDAQSPATTVSTGILFPEQQPDFSQTIAEDDDEDLDITAELQAGNNSGRDAEAANAAPAPIAGPSRAHIPRARQTDTSPLKPIQHKDIEMGNMSRDISGTTLTASVAKSRSCWQALANAVNGISRAYEEEYFPKTDAPTQQWKAFGERISPAGTIAEVSKAFAGTVYKAANDDFSRKWRSACLKISQCLDIVNEACVNAVVTKRYQPGDHEMV
ncbi:hypothetical protein CLAFUW4_01029 [Fulvia fulva]|uniref:Uncharacterized protein n=1 Tax=Passalora fulva TaxID=5499 RepID=A0A9Q8L8F2_PASFU|nr:uncharacterized protein CLAFUR5_01034 [Fulvia fulva]KAK4634177.1 hypothetical protein CLAFUR4_01030 [Fulvia fulva]KAK4636968.1 hypothetical protein CLAFUR0_01031 [Fulvia fulva]UJO12768.1 hypothetical protein CLAFUR5_01034 [Fulvia fulva]WPV08339.1 hypothetical protein CLAFUW4_01029 [Fulvia fulva]WPV23372.1 hypothetical protein CLAFUW7_01034 [Fulvia fulva]